MIDALKINGFLFCPQECEQIEEFIGSRDRDICGNLFQNSTSEKKHFTLEISSAPMALSEIWQWKGLLDSCNGDSWSFEGSTPEYSARGAEIVGTFTQQAQSQFGSNSLEINVGSTISTTISDKWTVSFFASTDSGVTWTHYSVRSDGAVFVDGVIGGAQTFVSVVSGVISFQTAYYDDFSYAAFEMPDAWLSAWDLTTATPPRPKVLVSCVIMEEPREMIASNFAIVHRAPLGTTDMLAQLTFALRTA